MYICISFQIHFQMNIIILKFDSYRQVRHVSFFLVSSVHRENYISISFQIELDMIVVTVLLSILSQMEFNLVQKIERKTVTTIISNSIWKEMEY